MQEITEYQLVYFIKGGGQFRFRLVNTAQWSRWTICSSADLAAIAAIMNERPVFFDALNGAISTQNEPVG